MATTRLTSESGIAVEEDQTFEQGIISGVIDFATQRPLLSLGVVLGIIVLFMLLSGGGGREEIIQRAAQQAAEEVTG